MEAAKNNNVQLLATLVDTNGEDENEYRFLVDGTRVKYVTVAPGILPKDDRTFAPTLLANLPPFPPGDWNVGHVGSENASGEPVFLSTAKDNLPSVKTTWQQPVSTIWSSAQWSIFAKIFTLPCIPSSITRSGQVYRVSWQTPYLEARRQPISGWRVPTQPRFLGHLTEEAGSSASSRSTSATPGRQDLEILPHAKASSEAACDGHQARRYQQAYFWCG